MTKKFNLFKWDPSIAMPYFVHYYSRQNSSVKYAKRKKDGEQQKTIFGSTSKVLCLTLMSIWISQCLLNYITIFYSIFSTIWQLPFKKYYFCTMPTQRYKKYFRDIQENTHQLFSKDLKIFHICDSHKMQWFLWGWSKTRRYVAF